MKTKKEQREYQREYYLKNRDKRIKDQLEYQKLINYKNQKTPSQRFIRNIKRKTRYHFPLEEHKCEFCGGIATEHHHNTRPIEFDKFNYICRDCHTKIHIREVKDGRNEKSTRKD